MPWSLLLRAWLALAPPEPLTPEDFAGHVALGAAQLARGDAAEAEAAYRVAVALSGEDLTARLGLADALAARARWREVAQLTAALVAERPGDAALHDRLALARFWLGELDAAEAESRQALRAQPDDLDARLGLGWVAQRRGALREARQEFQLVSARRPGDASAALGLAALDAAPRLAVWLRPSTTFFSGVSAGPLVGASLGAWARLDDRWAVSGLYRWVGSSSSSGTSADWLSAQQHEGHAALRFSDGAVSAGLHLAGVGVQASSAPPLAHSGVMAALDGALSAWATVTASVAASRYDDLTAWQGELGAWLPVGPHLAVFLGGRGQLVDGVPLASARAEVRLLGAGWLVAAGGGYGLQRRSVELETGVLSNLSDASLWRAGARASVQLGPVVSLEATYEHERLRAADSSALEYGAHRAVLGLGFTF